MMLRRLLIVVVIVLVLTGLSIEFARAKGPPSMVTISGPDWAEPVEITDPSVLEDLSFYQFSNPANQIEVPEVAAEGGYTVTRYVSDGGEMIAWDRVVYYPRADAAGIVYFEGLVDLNMWTQGQGHWYVASEVGDAAMRTILAVQATGDGAEEAALPDAPVVQAVVAAGVIGAMVGVLGLWIGRRSQAQQAISGNADDFFAG